MAELTPVVMPRVLERVRIATEPIPRRAPVADVKPLDFRRRWWVGWSLLLVDEFALQISLVLGWIVRSILGNVFPIQFSLVQYQSLACGMLVLPLGYALIGLYPGYGLGAVERFRRRLYTVTLLFVILIGWAYMVQQPTWSRGMLLVTFIFAALLGPVCESLTRHFLVRMRWWGTPVVVIGAGHIGRQLVHALCRKPELGLIPVAIFHDNDDPRVQHIAGVPVLGHLTQVRNLASRVKVCLMAVRDLKSQRMSRLSTRLPFPRIIIVPEMPDTFSLWISSRDLGGTIGLEVQKNLLLRRNWVIKRLIDYLLSVPLFLLSLPFLALFALWIKIVDRGPALFCHERAGFRGKTIRVWKLRTMYQDSQARLADHLAHDPAAREEWQRTFKLRNDPRVLPWVGNLLRKTSLDELPQLWNIIRGDMSLVGPRPFPRYHLEQFPRNVQVFRRSVLPGLTGLWQVSSRGQGSLLEQERLDMYYIRNWAMSLDLYILFRTAWVVLTGRGAY